MTDAGDHFASFGYMLASKHPSTIHGEGMHPDQQVYSQIDVTCPLLDFSWRPPRYIQVAGSAVMAPKGIALHMPFNTRSQASAL
jgi:hypothetical protein